MSPKLTLHLIPHLVLIKRKGREYLCNGLLLEYEGKLQIYVSTCYNPLRILEILLHELLHVATYLLTKNLDTLDKFDETIDKYIRIPLNN